MDAGQRALAEGTTEEWAALSMALDMLCQEMYEAQLSGVATETDFRIVYSFRRWEGSDCFLIAGI